MDIHFFEPGMIKPTGWIATQLRVLSEGFFPSLLYDCDDIGKSRWIGGSSDPSGELFPVWFEGFVRIAYMSENEKMKETAGKCVAKILNRQEENGWLSIFPAKEDTDLYPSFLMLNALIVYAQHSSDKTVYDAILRAVKAIDFHTDNFALTKNAHARFSVIKNVIDFLYKLTEDSFLTELSKKLECQAFSWERYENSIARNSRWSDAYNNALSLRMLPFSSFKEFDEKFVLACGSVSGVRFLERVSASAGSATSTMFEYLATLLKVFEKNTSSLVYDKIENLIFNAYFASANPTMTAVQKYEKLNQINASFNSSASLETVSFGKVLPEFVSSCVVRTEDGFCVNSYIPFTADLQYNGTPVRIETISEYPFRDSVKIVVTCPEPVSFTLSLRIPSWADEVRISAGSSPIYPLKNSFYKFTGIWSDVSEITLSFSADFKITRREDDLFTLSRGILLYAMPVDGKKTFENGKDESSYLLSASSDWSFGLVMANKDAIYKEISYEEKPVAQLPFSVLTPPVEAYMYARRVEWQMKDGEPIKKPLAVRVSEKKEMIKLVPYGCTSLKITAFPKA